MKITDIVLLGLAVLALPSFAQPDNNLPSRSLTIEGVYNADVTDARKVMPVPAKPEILSSESPVEYIREARPLNEYLRNPMLAPDSPESEPPSYSGLIRFGYGMFGNIDALANARIRIRENDMLRINGKLNGWNGKLEDDWTSRMYDAGFSAGYEHNLSRLRIGVNAGVGYQYVNFRPAPAKFQIHEPRDNGRNIMTGNIEATVSSSDIAGIYFNVLAGWYACSDDNISHNVSLKGRENLFRIKGFAGYDISQSWSVGLWGSAKASLYDWSNRLRFSFDYVDYVTVSARPQVSWTNTSLSAVAGFDVTVRNRIAPKIRVAPYLRLQYKVSSWLALYADVTGGAEDNDMRRFYATSPYWTDREQLTDGYTRMDASLGAIWNANECLEVSGRGGYRIMAGHLFQSLSALDVMGSVLTQSDATVGYGEISASLTTSDRLKASATAGYYKWKCEGDEEQLQMLPEFGISIDIEGKLSDKLTLNAGYQYAMMTSYVGERLPQVNILDVSLGYRVQSNLDIALKGTNLLGNRYYKYGGYRAQGTAILGSLLFRF